ncbi:MAG: hypothetical protein K0S53_646 [Bacteroidetes bacterium]|jgi:PKD repeat protein|nr:hypothetical protein [Bacteroidota bacterium]
MKKQLFFIFGLLITATLVKAQCTADYTYTVTAGTVSVTGSGTGSGTPGYSWQWGDGSFLSVGQAASHTYTASGTYSVCLNLGYYTPPSTTCTASKCQTVAITLVGVNEYIKNLKNVNIRPNPASSYVVIDYSLTQESDLSISVIDITGKVIDQVESEKKSEVGDHSIRYNTKNLSAGIYFIRFKTENGIESKKLIVD